MITATFGGKRQLTAYRYLNREEVTMSHHLLRCGARPVTVGLLVTLMACERAPDPVASATIAQDDPVVLMSHHGNPNPGLQKWLAGLRAATARFHRFEAAVDAGYGTPITPCLEEPGVGGQGFHYGDPSLIDGVVEQFKPELLLYEPQKNGRLRLVAVEFIVPFTAWTDTDPPVLHGQTFHRNETFQVWALHAWVFRHNPDGMFADWNPRVSCAHAS